MFLSLYIKGGITLINSFLFENVWLISSMTQPYFKQISTKPVLLNLALHHITNFTIKSLPTGNFLAHDIIYLLKTYFKIILLKAKTTIFLYIIVLKNWSILRKIFNLIVKHI